MHRYMPLERWHSSVCLSGGIALQYLACGELTRARGKFHENHTTTDGRSGRDGETMDGRVKCCSREYVHLSRRLSAAKSMNCSSPKESVCCCSNCTNSHQTEEQMVMLYASKPLLPCTNMTAARDLLERTRPGGHATVTFLDIP